MMDLTYSVSSKGSYADKCTLIARKRIYQKLSETIDLGGLSSILDVGVTADRDKTSSNFFENLYPDKGKITALSDQDASWMEKQYPGLNFVRGNGCDLPFHDNRFDLVFSSAVLEHVGSWDAQIAFISECFRVSKKYTFLTTPNRWHPIEFHTVLPFVHWLPKPVHRRLLQLLGKKDLAVEKNLNLLTKRDLKKMCGQANISNSTIGSISFFGFKSNLLLFLQK